MNKFPKKPSALWVILSTLIFIMVFVGGFYLVNNLLFPHLIESWQTIFISLGVSFTVAVGLLSGLAQLTGYSIKDLFSRTKSHEGVKDETESVTALGYQPSAYSQKIIRMVDEIQNLLYTNNENLPIVLTKCLMLCELAQISEADKEWVHRELNGYKDLVVNDGDRRFLKEGVDNLADYRIVQPYFKMQYVDSETGMPDLMNLPVPKMFIAQPVPQLIEEIQIAKTNNVQEFSYSLIKVDKKAFLDVRKFALEHIPGSTMPDDLRTFIKVSDYEDILNSTRKRILQIVQQAQKKGLE